MGDKTSLIQPSLLVCIMLEHVGLVAMLAPCWHMFEAIPRADVRREVQWAAAAGVLLFCVTSYLIPRLSVFTLRAGLKGRDLCKKGSPGGDVDMYAWRTLVCMRFGGTSMVCARSCLTAALNPLALWSACSSLFSSFVRKCCIPRQRSR